VKWFKHETDGNRSEALLKLRAEFGWEGVAWWYTILEIVAEKMDGTDRCFVEFPVSEWCRKLVCRPQKLRRYLVATTQLLHTEVVETDLIIRISIPNLLKKRDNYSKDLEVTSKKLPSKIQIQSKEEETELISIPPTPLAQTELPKVSAGLTEIVKPEYKPNGHDPTALLKNPHFANSKTSNKKGRSQSEIFRDQCASIISKHSQATPNQKDREGMLLKIQIAIARSGEDTVRFALAGWRESMQNQNDKNPIRSPIGFFHKKLNEIIPAGESSA
jgi:hypothetical protein